MMRVNSVGMRGQASEGLLPAPSLSPVWRPYRVHVMA